MSFDSSRARTYRKEALVIGLQTDEPVVFVKPSWSQGCGYESGRRLQPGQVEQLRELLISFGFDGCQIMPGAFFTLSSDPGNVYGCEPDQEDSRNPNAYEEALSRDSVIDALDILRRDNGLTPKQARLVFFVLSSVRQKMKAVQAYQVTKADGEIPVETILEGQGGSTESIVVARPGDWLIKNPSGEVYRIRDEKFQEIGYYEVG